MAQTDNNATRLQMYAYYGNVQWQIFAILFAGALVIATVPIFAGNHFNTKLPLPWDFAINEFFAVLLIGIGGLFWRRNRFLGHRWVHWETEGWYGLDYWIDRIEGNEYTPHLPPTQIGPKGIHLLLALIFIMACYLGFLLWLSL